MQKAIPILPKHIFWDIDLKDSTFKKYPGFVIVRVFERGDIPEIRAIRRYYGDELIKNEVVRARYIEPETLNFLSAIYNIPQKKFKCYTAAL
ncbi:MAG: hypothetical protein ABIX01_23000 [Chitinophagaceae bacterium]